jgi:hypothetical protein
MENEVDPGPVIDPTFTNRVLLARPVFSIVSVLDSAAGLPFFEL